MYRHIQGQEIENFSLASHFYDYGTPFLKISFWVENPHLRRLCQQTNGQVIIYSVYHRRYQHHIPILGERINCLRSQAASF
jgi:hypothetical protein